MDAPKLPTDRRRADTEFQGLVEHSLVGMAIVQDGRFLYVNPKYCEIFGYSRDELLGGITPLDLTADADRGRAALNMEKRLIGTAPGVDYVFKGKRKDGSIIDVEIHGALMEIGGRPALIASLMDVTARRRGEEKLRRLQEQTKRERDTAQRYLDIAAVMILVLNADETVALINRQGCRILEYDGPEEILGKSWIDFCIPERMRDTVRKAFRRLVSGKDPGMEYHENPVLTKTGDERIIAWHNTQIRDDKGSIIATLSSGEDITEHRLADENLRKSEERFHTIFDSVSEGIFVSDANAGKFIDVNETGCAMFGYDRRELIGGDIGTLATGVPPYTREAAAAWFEKAQSGSPQLFEWHCKAKDGHLFWAEISLRCLFFGDLYVGLASIRDITERKEAEEALRRNVEATIQVIASTVEVRDPYTAGHQQRVAQLAVAIAREMRLPEDQLEGIKFAGVIHDLGKIKVPAEILSKPGKLSKPEFELLKGHPQSGYDILKAMDFPWPIAEIVRQHHERVDGSGYPDGLKGNETRVEARILAVADVVESMTSHRPYRPALDLDVALAEIDQGKGRIYDGAAVEACLKLFRADNFKFD
ncbi:MAG TPA: PAS domain S-box protein [Alphaproteobacteria bacterium]|nr:PAS domain S-box protein [Alphaproteobacteria bacterium]